MLRPTRPSRHNYSVPTLPSRFQNVWTAFASAAILIAAFAPDAFSSTGSASAQSSDAPARHVYRTEPPWVPPPAAQSGSKARGRPQLPAPPPVEEVYVFTDSLDGRPLDDEGGWTHYDNSAGPTAWHLDTFLACNTTAWWCGLTDSSWTGDSNRKGYANSWDQFLENKVNLAGMPPGTPVTFSFDYRINVEQGYDYGVLQVNDVEDLWIEFGRFTGKAPNSPNGCASFSVQIPDTLVQKWLNLPGGPQPIPFRFVFHSDIEYSSEDGLYNGDGWIIDNIEVEADYIRFFDNMENGMGAWTRTTLPGVGDYFQIASNVTTEDVCTDNRSNIWVDWDPVTLSVVPRLDNRLITPPVDIDRSSQVLVAFDIYRNLPLNACFYYSLNYRSKNVGDANWGSWVDPTGLLYYGQSKDWIRQKVELVGAGGKDSVEVMFIVKDYGPIYCGGSTGYANIYPLFDNVAIGVRAVTPPVFVQRDLDLFNDTFRTTAFFANDNFNTPQGDSAVVSVSTPRGYKNGFMHYRFNGGSWASIALQQSDPALPSYRYADVPTANYPAGTVLQYYFAVTDSTDSTSYLPKFATQTQTYFEASILPVKSATNPSLGCTDSLAQILFINNNNGRETEPYIASALKAQGYKFDTWDVNGPTSGAGNTPGGSPAGDPFYAWPGATTNDLLRYSTIIWHAGSLTQYTLRKPDQALFQSWIQQPGKNRNLFIAGDNVAWDLISGGQDHNSFLSFTMGTSYLRDIWENTPQDTLHPIVTGLPTSPSAGRSMHVSTDCPGMEKTDLLYVHTSAPSRGKAGDFLRYPNNFPAAIRFATKYVSFGSDSARSVMMGFNWNLIEETGERLRLIKNIMWDYFQVPACFYATAVGDDAAVETPRISDRLFQNAPNPFNPETVIRYSVANSGRVAIRVYSVSGSLVRTLIDGHHPPGQFSVRWDGRNDHGEPLASGVYFYKLETAAGARDSKKLIMLK